MSNAIPSWNLTYQMQYASEILIDLLIQRFNHVILKGPLSFFYENVSTLHSSRFRALYRQTAKIMNEKPLKDQRSYYVNFRHFAPS